jgi:ABC-type lipoprotein export system ATPase subunit
MAIRSFVVGPAKGLKHAAADDLPNLVVIAGPNGAGKSTLLHQLYVRRNEFIEPGTRVIYLGPHRPWRKSTLGGAAMYALPYTYRQLSEMDSFPGFAQFVPQGLQFLQSMAGQMRDPDTADESYGTVKYAISKIGFRRQNRVAQEFDSHGGMIPPDTVPEIFTPLRELTRYLLPHLQFEKVDLSDDQNIRVLFRRIDGDARDLIDIDDLSSGEKAVVSLFLPFLESQIDALLSVEESAPEPITALIDEPDLHLHPTLQASLIEYLREMADRSDVQFIITTHSPTMLDVLRDDELFIVAPLASVADGNQFLRVTASQERLETMRELTGSTHLVTRLRPIVFVEGTSPTAKGTSDQRLIELLMPEAASWVLVPTGGRSEAVRSAGGLRDVAPDNLPGLPVFCLVDADQATGDDPDYAISWSVAMIENLLLDPDAMWNLLAPYRERLTLANAADIESELRGIARGMRDDEIRLRVKSSVKPLRIFIQPTDAGAVEAAVEAARDELDNQLDSIGGAERITSIVETAQQAVDRILEEGRELEAFRGKQILRAFYDLHGKHAGFNYPSFVYTLAQHVKDGSRLHELVAVPVRRIQRYVPPDLVPVLDGACNVLPVGSPAHDTARSALENAQTARAAWEAGSSDEVDRSDLREALVRTARALQARGNTELHQALLKAVVEVGVG